MTVKEIADRLVSLCREADFETAYKELYSAAVVSIEPEGAPNPKTEGLDAVLKKSEAWYTGVEEIHRISVSEPLVTEDFFACNMHMDISFKQGERIQMEELCVYRVSGGKIVLEQFFYETAPAEIA